MHPRQRIVLTIIALIPGPASAAPVVDGAFDEWTDDTSIATDEAGDGTPFDITEVHADNRGTVLFVHFDTTTVLNLQSGDDDDPTLRLELGFQNGDQLTVDLRNRTAYTGGNPGNYVPWSTIDFVSMSTYAADRFELQVDLAPFGLAPKDSVSINFSGADALEDPVPFGLKAPAEPLLRRPSDRQPCTTFRLASLNTLFGGLLDPARQDAIGRLVQAAAADIYCFQEQNASDSAIAARLELLDPLHNDAAWNVRRVGDTVIASPHLLIAVPHSGDVAAALDLGPDGRLVLFSIHPPCCGYIGSSQDQARVAEMQNVVETFADLRAGSLGAALLPFRYAPVIVVGDWNLVGSRTPLDLLEQATGPALAHWPLPHLIGSRFWTWRDQTESPGGFPPGLLDLLAHSSGGLIRRNGFLLHSGELNAEELQALGLQSNDSEASDHLMIVADFSTVVHGDINGDGTTNAADIAQLLGSWGACPGCPADLNGDGMTDPADLAQLLGGWGSCPAGANR